jgi:deoxyribonuclease IV
MNNIKFGTSGNPPNFFKSKFGKNRINAVDWINEIGLNAYEYLMTYGARTRPEVAKEVGEKARRLGVKLSVHAPYYVVFTSEKEGTFENSVNEMVKTLKLAEIMGAEKIVFHPGYHNVPNPSERIIKGINEVKKIYAGPVKILPETMGKKSQYGSLKEVLHICKETGCELCLDFAHIHAREGGSLNSVEDFRKIILEVERVLGREVVERLHCHFYPVEFTEKGEKVHRAHFEKNYFPHFEHFLPVIKEFNMNPTLISESRDSQDGGALEMKEMVNKLFGEVAPAGVLPITEFGGKK